MYSQGNLALGAKSGMLAFTSSTSKEIPSPHPAGVLLDQDKGSKAACTSLSSPWLHVDCVGNQVCGFAILDGEVEWDNIVLQ